MRAVLTFGFVMLLSDLSLQWAFATRPRRRFLQASAHARPTIRPQYILGGAGKLQRPACGHTGTESATWSHQLRRAERAPAANLAMTSLFHIAHQRRGLADVRR